LRALFDFSSGFPRKSNEGKKMSESNLVNIDSALAQLFQAARHSLDPVTGDFMLRRVVPITIYIDGVHEGLADVADDLREETLRILAEVGYPQVGEWGPFNGSYVTTIFGKGEQWEIGFSFQRNLLALKSRLLHLSERIPPQVAGSIRVVMVVGTLVIHLAGPAAVAATLPVTIPIVALEYAALTVEAFESVEAIRHLLNLNLPSEGFPRKGGKFTF
jgi:hypothetical protein